ncbi:hypothetical protein Tco_1249013 [Tanacetum coccineum]
MGHDIKTYPSEPTKEITKRCTRNNIVVEADGEKVECSSQSCQSCTARVIADCIAVCCCPCAVVNFFTLTLVKLPYMMGRKCLGNMAKKKKKKKSLKNGEKDVISRKDQGENVDLGRVTAIEEEVDVGGTKYSARFEAERVWLELYRVDNLGFGRVSFTGIQSLGNMKDDKLEDAKRKGDHVPTEAETGKIYKEKCWDLRFDDYKTKYARLKKDETTRDLM